MQKYDTDSRITVPVRDQTEYRSWTGETGFSYLKMRQTLRTGALGD